MGGRGCLDWGWDFDGIDLGPAASLGIQKDGFRGHCDGDGLRDFFEEVISQHDRGFSGLFPAGILGAGFFCRHLILH